MSLWVFEDVECDLKTLPPSVLPPSQNLTSLHGALERGVIIDHSRPVLL